MSGYVMTPPVLAAPQAPTLAVHGQGPAHGAFAATHHADQIEVYPLEPPSEILARVGAGVFRRGLGAGSRAGVGRAHRERKPP